jgi:hypothetical protein
MLCGKAVAPQLLGSSQCASRPRSKLSVKAQAGTGTVGTPTGSAAWLITAVFVAARLPGCPPRVVECFFNFVVASCTATLPVVTACCSSSLVPFCCLLHSIVTCWRPQPPCACSSSSARKPTGCLHDSLPSLQQVTKEEQESKDKIYIGFAKGDYAPREGRQGRFVSDDASKYPQRSEYTGGWAGGEVGLKQFVEVRAGFLYKFGCQGSS